MLETLRIVNKVDSSLFCNQWIFNLRKVPLVKKLFPESLYANVNTKNRLVNIFKVLKFFWSLAKVIIFVLLFYALPINLIYGDFMKGSPEKAGFAVYVFYLVNIFIGGTQNHLIKEEFKNYSITCLSYLKIDPKEYFISTGIMKYIKKAIANLPVFVVMLPFFGLTHMQALFLVINMFAFRFFVDGISLVFYEKTSKLKHKLLYLFIVDLAALALAYVPYLTRWEMEKYLALASPLFTAAFIVLGIIGWVLILNYDNYSLLRRAELDQGAEIDSLVKESNKEGIVLEDEDLNTKDAEGLKEKTGYNYLNSLFIHRYSKVFKKYIKYLSIGCFAVPIGLAITQLLAINVFHVLDKNMLEHLYTESLGIWFMLFYLLTVGKRYTGSLFSNIDVHLLNYSWYREPGAVIENYIIRLKKSIIMNSVIALSLMAGVLISSLLTGISLIKLIPLLTIMVVLTLFYSIHYLTLYYLVQPYDKDSQVKNPIYSVVNGAIYFITYILLNQDLSPMIIYIISGVVVVYLGASLVALKHKATETFRLRD